MRKYIVITIAILMSALAAQTQTLEEYFRIAAENNPGLQAKYKEFEASMQKVAQVNSLPDPTFSFGYVLDHNAPNSHSPRCSRGLAHWAPKRMLPR